MYYLIWQIILVHSSEYFAAILKRRISKIPQEGPVRNEEPKKEETEYPDTALYSPVEQHTIEADHGIPLISLC